MIISLRTPRIVNLTLSVVFYLALWEASGTKEDCDKLVTIAGKSMQRSIDVSKEGLYLSIVILELGRFFNFDCYRFL